MFHLIRARVTRGKTVPESVADHPLLFATLTAPSFGRVHTAGRCHPGDPSRRCSHGRPIACGVVHAEGAEGRRSAGLLGQRCVRTATTTPRTWCGSGSPRPVATVQYAKVAEFQRRGAVHFHALIRLDGPRTTDGVTNRSGRVTADLLATLVTEAASAVQLHAPRSTTRTWPAAWSSAGSSTSASSAPPTRR